MSLRGTKLPVRDSAREPEVERQRTPSQEKAVARRGKSFARRCRTYGLAPLLGIAAAGYLAIHGKAAARLDLLQIVDTVAALTMERAVPQLTVAANLTSSQKAAKHFTWSAGDWRVRWNSVASQLSVTRNDRADVETVLWASRAGQPFAAAAKADSAPAESHGNFQIRERLLWQCVHQRLDSLTSGKEEVELRGTFDDDDHCRTVRWRLVFTAADNANHLSFALSVTGRTAHGQDSRAPNRAQLTKALGKSVAVWGLGVQFRHFNLRGHCVPAFISEQGIGRGAPETQPMSFMLNVLGGGAGGNDYTT